MFIPPPERFSMMNGCPSRFCSSSPSARTKTSLVPPALLAVITRTGLVGQVCAAAGSAASTASTIVAMRVVMSASRSIQLQEPPRIAGKDLGAVGVRYVQVLNQLDGAGFQRCQRRRVAAVEHAVRPYPVQHHPD